MSVSSAPSFREKPPNRVVHERARAIWRRLPVIRSGVYDAPGAFDVWGRAWGPVAEFFEDKGYGVPLGLFYLSVLDTTLHRVLLKGRGFCGKKGNNERGEKLTKIFKSQAHLRQVVLPLSS